MGEPAQPTMLDLVDVLERIDRKLGKIAVLLEESDPKAIGENIAEIASRAERIDRW